ncbi:MAG: hypothetical protein HY658_08870 [Actinobacteria bacterium]|nr:hypothetical protein [Actinomycetota bacterium]
MAVRRNDLAGPEGDVLYRRYIEALRRHGPPEEDDVPSPGRAIRSCSRCGRHTMFRLDPEGTWYECTRCGQYA